MAAGGQRRNPSTHRTPAQDKKHSSDPKQKKDRAKRNAARAKLGLKVGDKRDAHHKKPIKSGGSNAKSNLEAVSRKKNRGWKRSK